MIKRHPDIGLDFGKGKARLAWVQEKRRGETRLLGFQSIELPAGLMEMGIMMDPVAIGTELKQCVQEMNLAGGRVAVAVPGPQVYMRRLTMPGLKWEELRRAVYFQAYEFLPIPVEDAIMDIFPLRRYQDSQGKKVELFFAAVRRQQVDDMVQACTSAGLKPVVMDVEPLAAKRAWGGDPVKTIILLHVSAANPYLTIFTMGVPIYHCSLNLEELPELPVSLRENPLLPNGRGIPEGYDSPGAGSIADLIQQVKDAIAYCSRHYSDGPLRPEVAVLDASGGRPGLEADLAHGLDMTVELAGRRAAGRIKLPDSMSDQQRYELEQEFALAMGLAMRR